MNIINNSFRTAQRFASLMILLVCALAANAEVKVTMDDFTVAVGQTHEVAVNVSNDEATGSTFGVDITLPEGLTFEPAYVNGAYAKKNDERLTSSHVITSSLMGTNGKVLRVSIYSASNKVFNGNEGAVFYFTVKASADLAATDYINLSGKINAPGAAESTKVSAKCAAHNPEKYIDAILSSSVEAISANVGDIITFDVNLANATSLTSLQGNIILPEGLEPVMDVKEQDYLTPNYNRLTDAHSLSSNYKNNTLKVLLFSAGNFDLQCADGALFTVTLKATKKIENASIVLNGFEVSKSSGYYDKQFEDIEIPVVVSFNEDINGDNVFDIDDVLDFLNNYLDGEDIHDFNGDGEGDIDDVMYLLDLYLEN